MAITTAFCTSAKSEFFMGAHNFGAVVTPTGTTTNNSPVISTMSSVSGIVLGDSIVGNVVPVGATISAINSNVSITMSANANASVSTSFTISADTLKIALIKGTPSGTYGAASTNYTNITGNADETTGSGYTAGGVVLTNVGPTISGTGAYVNFSPNPSWTTATFNTLGCMIYNSTARMGGTSGTNTTGAGRALGVFTFGSNTTVSSGTLTVVMPAAAIATAVFRLV